VIGFDGPHGGRSLVMLMGQSANISPGAMVVGQQAAATIPVGRSLLGRVINGLGETIDGGAPPIDMEPRPLLADPTSPLRRQRITKPLPTGVRAIDAILTLGKGQRVGIFSGAGVGKSTLLGVVARNTSAD